MKYMTRQISIKSSDINDILDELGLPITNNNREIILGEIVKRMENDFGFLGVREGVIEEVDSWRDYDDWDRLDHEE